MKKILLSFFIALGALTFTTTAYAEAEVKQVCKDKVGKDGKPVKDKAGKVQQECKKVKIHKKLEGTELPKK